MAIKSKIIYYDRTYTQFQTDKNGLNKATEKDLNGDWGNIPHEAIVFLGDGNIWTHGKLIKCVNDTNLSNYVTINTKLTITGLKTFKVFTATYSLINPLNRTILENNILYENLLSRINYWRKLYNYRINPRIESTITNVKGLIIGDKFTDSKLYSLQVQGNFEFATTPFGIYRKALTRITCSKDTIRERTNNLIGNFGKFDINSKNATVNGHYITTNKGLKKFTKLIERKHPKIQVVVHRCLPMHAFKNSYYFFTKEPTVNNNGLRINVVNSKGPGLYKIISNGYCCYKDDNGRYHIDYDKVEYLHQLFGSFDTTSPNFKVLDGKIICIKDYMLTDDENVNNINLNIFNNYNRSTISPPALIFSNYKNRTHGKYNERYYITGRFCPYILYIKNNHNYLFKYRCKCRGRYKSKFIHKAVIKKLTYIHHI